MGETDPGDLRNACRKERDPGAWAEMTAASMPSGIFPAAGGRTPAIF